jgi:beta-phosphoglucomutase
MTRAVLWDLDGTIADNEELHYQAWKITLAAYGVQHSFAQFRAGFGRRNAEILPELLPDATPEMIEYVGDEKEATFRRLLRESDLQPLPGVVEWLDRFRAAGVRQAISSSGPMANIVATVDKLAIGDFFMALLSGSRLPKSKPDPALFLNTAHALGAAPPHCLVIEDSIHGIAAARRAGMGSIAVGALASSPALAELLAQERGPVCLPVGELAKLTWAQVETLWESTMARSS